MSAFGGKADMTIGTCPLSQSLLGVKRTRVDTLPMSAYDPKRTFAYAAPHSPLSQQVGITTPRNADGPSGHASSRDPSHRPSQGPTPARPSHRPIHRYSAFVPSDHASSVAPIARPSNYRGRRWQPQEAGGSVPLG